MTQPDLIINPVRDAQVPKLPSAYLSDVTVWCDSHNVVGALSHIVAGVPWLHVLEVASFKLEPIAHRATAFSFKASHTQIIDEFRRTVWPTLLQLQGLEVLHASAVRTQHGVVAFCAPSETGKSTIGYGLSLLGYPAWADDTVVFSSTSSVLTYSLPNQARLRPTSAAYFGRAGAARSKGPSIKHRGTLVPATAQPLIAVCVLEQVSDLTDSVQIERLLASEALTCLLENAVFFSLTDPLRKRQMIAHYLSLVTCLKTYRVRFRRSLETLPALLDALQKQVLDA